MVWSRCDRPARLIITWDTTDAFRNPRTAAGGLALPATGLTATAELTDLPAGQTVFWRAAFEDADRAGLISEPTIGRLRTPEAGGGRVRFLFGGDQNSAWGIDPDLGGMPHTPFDKLVWYGQGDIDGATGALTVTIRDIAGKALHSQVLEPRR